MTMLLTKALKAPMENNNNQVEAQQDLIKKDLQRIMVLGLERR